MNTTQITTELIKSYFSPINKSSGYSKLEWLKEVFLKEELIIKDTLKIIAERRGSAEYEYWISQLRNKKRLPKKLFIEAKKSKRFQTVFTTKTSFVNYMLPTESKGLGLGKKTKIIAFLDKIFGNAIKIKETKSFKTIIKAFP